MTFQNVAFSKAIWWFHKCMFWQQQWEVEWFKYSLLTLKFLLFQNLTRLFSKIQNIMNFGNFYIEAWEYMSARTESIIPLAFSNRSIVPHCTHNTIYFKYVPTYSNFPQNMTCNLLLCLEIGLNFSAGKNISLSH